jgi:hypothetical protein
VGPQHFHLGRFCEHRRGGRGERRLRFREDARSEMRAKRVGGDGILRWGRREGNWRGRD